MEEDQRQYPVNWPAVAVVYLSLIATSLAIGFTEMVLSVLAIQTLLVVANWLGFRYLNWIKEALLLYVFVPIGVVWFFYALLHLSPRM